MNSFLRATSVAAAIMVSALLTPFDAADAMTVQPVVVDLTTSGHGMSQVITVQNTFSDPLPVEIRVEEVTPTSTGVKGTGKDPGDLLVFPPQALIPPGQTQTFRVQWVGDPALPRSKHYYVTVAQLPVQLPQGQSAIQILYNFQVLVSVAPAGIKPAVQIVGANIVKNKAGKPIAELTVKNDSAAHGYLSRGRLEIVERDASGHQVFDKVLPGPEIQQTIGFGLIAAGQTRTIQVPIVLPVEGGKLEVTFKPDAR